MYPNAGWILLGQREREGSERGRRRGRRRNFLFKYTERMVLVRQIYGQTRRKEKLQSAFGFAELASSIYMNIASG
jgi:hypothetical protein